ncbi:MAG TPA: hypothetical protein DCL54_05110 [Alphaproteobacteria bacterium]|nr:hypothetical protein [Alphaproteobacteria bacterium]HAJ45944.1 hypothetical protein [Alphaproteobacteria bacterium]
MNTAYAPPLVTGEDTCMGSSSVGGQAVGFGLSIGTTWTDTNCQRLKNSRQLHSLGYQRAAVALMCLNEDVATAMHAAGHPCYVADERSHVTVFSTQHLNPDIVEAEPEPMLVRHEWITSNRPVPDAVCAKPRKPCAPKRKRTRCGC